jgi:hypothetical protein
MIRYLEARLRWCGRLCFVTLTMLLNMFQSVHVHVFAFEWEGRQARFTGAVASVNADSPTGADRYIGGSCR